MSLTNPGKVITEERLSQFYGSILPYLGGMPEVVANKFSKGNLYSTDEKMIGQWTDGKPLYQKTIDCGALPNATSKNIAHNINNVADIISIEGCAISDTGHLYISLPIINDNDAKLQLCIYVNGANIVYEARNNNFSAYNRSYVTLHYTKTTDSAISIGSDTDYSAIEKIVGTWINGKPLYQKTFAGSSPTKATPFNTGLVNCANAMIVDGYLTTTSNNNYDIGLYLMPASDGSQLLYHSNDTAYTGKPFVCTLQYTKTTD